MSYRVLVLDVDGVLTDGAIYVDSSGAETVRFHVLDGLAIRRWLEAGKTCVWITGRRSMAVQARAASLGVEHVLAGVENKARELADFLTGIGCSWNDVVYVGDDLPDVECVSRAGLGIAVQSAVGDVVGVADMITKAPGGHGAVREVVDGLLRTEPTGSY